MLWQSNTTTDSRAAGFGHAYGAGLRTAAKKERQNSFGERRAPADAAPPEAEEEENRDATHEGTKRRATAPNHRTSESGGRKLDRDIVPNRGNGRTAATGAE